MVASVGSNSVGTIRSVTMLSSKLPSNSLLTTTTWAVAGLSFVLLLLRGARRRERKRMPPGPSRVPLLGHLFHIPRELPWEKYHQLCQDQGSDIIALDVLGTNIIILDSAEAVNELLERRSHIYSNRPWLPMISDLMGWEFNIGLMPYGERWRAHRKMFHQSFQANAVTAFHRQELKAAKHLLQGLHTSPEGYMSHFRLMAGYVVLSVAYGIEPTGEDDPYIKISEEAVRYLVEAAVPGAFLVDVIPAMKYIPEWMPFANFQTFARTSRSHIEKMRQNPFRDAKNNSRPSFVQERLEAMDLGTDPKAYEEIVMNTASAMFVGGFDTIIAAMCGFLFAMMTHPEVQRNAQAEIDAVLPSGQLPSFEDQASLPYITAMVKEVLRWKPIVPMAAAHVLDVDDEYKGYHLPAGSMIIGNAWAILKDENLYPSAKKFQPERFIKQNGQEPCPDPTTAFGFGRRICPGRLMALDVLWVAFASILATFEISKPTDDEGKVIEPVYEATSSSLVFMPLPFKCSIRPRNSKAIELLSSMGDI